MAEFRHIVRVVYKDLPGDKPVQWALSELKGVGPSFARAAALAVGVNPSEKLGALDEETVKKLEEVLKDPARYGFPSWMLNRRKDYETGRTCTCWGRSWRWRWRGTSPWSARSGAGGE
jgi:small subunit ribosomal protein S13